VLGVALLLLADDDDECVVLLEDGWVVVVVEDVVVCVVVVEVVLEVVVCVLVVLVVLVVCFVVVVLVVVSSSLSPEFPEEPELEEPDDEPEPMVYEPEMTPTFSLFCSPPTKYPKRLWEKSRSDAQPSPHSSTIVAVADIPLAVICTCSPQCEPPSQSQYGSATTHSEFWCHWPHAPSLSPTS
jgi:hypothetical protein